MPELRQKTHEEEIRELERLLEEKKRVFGERGIEKEPKETFREVIREYIETKKQAQSAPAPSAPPVIQDGAQRTFDDQKKKQRETELEKLIAVSFEDGILEAVSLAERTTPWLLDELHDRLVDEYYQKLVQGNRLKEL